MINDLGKAYNKYRAKSVCGRKENPRKRRTQFATFITLLAKTVHKSGNTKTEKSMEGACRITSWI
jgi:hypothetical protein